MTDLAEERRLFYVALTRAEKRIYISCTESRTIYGKTENLAPSPYLSEINDLLQEISPEAPPRPKSRQVQLTLFS